MVGNKEGRGGARKDVKLMSTIAEMKHVLLLEPGGLWGYHCIDLPLHAHGLEQEIAVTLPYEGDTKAGHWLRSAQLINHESRVKLIIFIL